MCALNCIISSKEHSVDRCDILVQNFHILNQKVCYSLFLFRQPPLRLQLQTKISLVNPNLYNCRQRFCFVGFIVAFYEILSDKWDDLCKEINYLVENDTCPFLLLLNFKQILAMCNDALERIIFVITWNFHRYHKYW